MDNKLKQNLRMLCLLMMTLIVQGVWAQVRTVTGTVSDGKDPLIGVTVQVKGNAKVGTITDMDGKYTIEVSSPGTILVYSYVGYQTTEKMAGQNAKLDVVMKADDKSLDEVVVVGYGGKRFAAEGRRLQERQQPLGAAAYAGSVCRREHRTELR